MESISFACDSEHLAALLARIPNDLHVVREDSPPRRPSVLSSMCITREPLGTNESADYVIIEVYRDVELEDLELLGERRSGGDDRTVKIVGLPRIGQILTRSIRFRNQVACLVLDDPLVNASDGHSTLLRGDLFVQALRRNLDSYWIEPQDDPADE